MTALKITGWIRMKISTDSKINDKIEEVVVKL